jgi:hypothetical protein
MLEKQKKRNLSQIFSKVIIPGKEQSFWKSFNYAANFFKHGDIDPDGVLENVHEEFNENLIFISCLLYADIVHHWSAQMVGFFCWYMLMYPDMIVDSPDWNLIVQSHEIAQLRNVSRAEQLKTGSVITEKVISQQPNGINGILME